MTGRLVAEDGTPLAAHEVVVVANGWRWGATPEERFARLHERTGTTTDESGRFIAETSTMHACLANLPALLVVVIPVAAGEKLMHEPLAPPRRGATLYCALVCTGVGCGRPTLRDVSLLTPGTGGGVRALPLEPTIRFTRTVEEPKTMPDGHAVRREIAMHDAD